MALSLAACGGEQTQEQLLEKAETITLRQITSNILKNDNSFNKKNYDGKVFLITECVLSEADIGSTESGVNRVAFWFEGSNKLTRNNLTFYLNDQEYAKVQELLKTDENVIVSFVGKFETIDDPHHWMKNVYLVQSDMD